MTGITRDSTKLSLSGKLSRLAARLRDPEWRRYGKLLFACKMMGVGAVLLIMLAVNIIPALPNLLSSPVYAADEVKAPEPLYPTDKAADVINPVNTAWTLLAAFLVFGMQVGF